MGYLDKAAAFLTCPPLQRCEQAHTNVQAELCCSTIHPAALRCVGEGVWEGSCLPQGKALSPFQLHLPSTLSKGASKRVSSSDTAWPRRTTSFGAVLYAGSQALGCSWRNPSSCPFSWLPVPGRGLCFGAYPKATPSMPVSTTLCQLLFTWALQKREERGKQTCLSKRLHITSLSRQEGPQHFHYGTES